MFKKLFSSFQEEALRRTLLTEIENLYAKFSAKYGRKQFDIEKFFDKYHAAIDSKKNEVNFLKQELLLFHDLLKSEQAKEKRLTPASSQSGSAVDSITNSFKDRYKNFPCIAISRNAPEEITYLAGAMVAHFSKEFPKIYSLFNKIRNSAIRQVVADFPSFEEALGRIHKENLPKEFYNYKREIEFVKSSDECQKKGQRLLKISFQYFESIRKLFIKIENESLVKEFPGGSEAYYDFKKNTSTLIENYYHAFRLKGLM